MAIEMTIVVGDGDGCKETVDVSSQDMSFVVVVVVVVVEIICVYFEFGR